LYDNNLNQVLLVTNNSENNQMVILNSNGKFLNFITYHEARLIIFNVLLFFYNTDQDTFSSCIQHYLLFKLNILKQKNYNIKLRPLLEVKESLGSLRE
jgi:hypothetical protein